VFGKMTARGPIDVTGKESILFGIAEASLARPDDPVRQVVYPAVTGGEQTRRELVHEFRTKGPVYRRTVRTTLRASYTNHYRRALIELLDVLEFRSNNATNRPVLDALYLIRRNTELRATYYPAGESRGTFGGSRPRSAPGGDTVPLIDMLKEAVLRTGCLNAVTAAAGRGDLAPDVLAERLLLASYAYGTNTGIRAIAGNAQTGHSEDDIRYDDEDADEEDDLEPL
jgi:hypothetical protein